MEIYQADLREKTYKKPGILLTGIIYSIVVTLFIFVGYRVQTRGFYSGVLITEVILILLPPLLILYYFKYDIKKVLRLNKVDILNLFLIFFIMLFSIPVVGVFNIANIWLVRHIFGKANIAQPPIAVDYKGLLLNVLAIGLLAGICEEVLFRGVIQRGLEKLGAVTAIIFTAFLFSIMHLYFEKLFGTFLLGSLIGFIVYRTNSLYGGIFAHFANNTIGVVVMFAANKLADIAKTQGIEPITDTELIFDMFNHMPMEQVIAVIISWAFIILFSVTILAALIFALVKNTSRNEDIVQIMGKTNKKKEGRAAKAELLAFLPGILFLSVLYVLEGMTLMGIENTIIGIIYKILGVKL